MPDVLSQAVFVDGHAYRRVHANVFERADFTAGLDATGGNDRVGCGGAELTEPFEIGAGHAAFAIDVGAEESGAEGLELGHDLFGVEFQVASPSVSDDAAFFGVEREHDFAGVDFCPESAEES